MVKRAGGALLNAIAFDPNSPRTLNAQLASALRQAILDRALLPGERLPATRVLAADLSISRSTVVEAFEQLVSEGLIETMVGSGSFVSKLSGALPKADAQPQPELTRVAQPERLARLMDTAREQFASRIAHSPRAFTTAMPAYDAFPMAQWARLVSKHWHGDRATKLGYNDPLGHPPLREAIARHLRGARGVSCDASQVFVVAGAQQAFQLIASTLVDPGEAVWFENPGAIGARNCFVIHGARVVPVPVDGNGIRVNDGLVAAPDFRLVFTTPSHQQPLGAKMSQERRIALLSAAADAGAFVIEDDWDGEFCLSGRPHPALKAIDSGDRVIYVGTFSKSMFPALRLGYIVAPRSLVATFEVALRAYLPGVPTSLQAAVAAFIDEGHFAAHVRRMCRLYGERLEVMLSAGGAQLSRWLDIQPTTMGLHTIAWLRQGLNGEVVARAAAADNLTVSPISRFCMTPHSAEGLVLGFSGVSNARIEEGVGKLATVLRAVEAQ